MDWTVRASNPGGSSDFRTVQTSAEAPLASSILGTGYISQVLNSQGVALTTQPHLQPSLKKE
jgi:hypothetical protein